MAWRSYLALLAIGNLSLSYAVSVDEAFPGGVSGTSTAEVKCRSGYTVGGGATDDAKKQAYLNLAPCRIFCECVGGDGSCNYCCKYTQGTGCSRHEAVYAFTGVTKCAKCYKPPPEDANGATLTLHASGVMGRIGTSSVDNSKKWISRGTNYIVDIVENSAGMGFSYYDFLSCWGLDVDNIPVGWGTSTLDCPNSDSDYPSTEEGTVLAPVSTATDYVPPDEELSPVLNQGGCGNCYIQSSMAVVTDRILKQADSGTRASMKANAVSYSTGHTTRCHYNPDAGDACDGGMSSNVLKQMTGQSVSAKKPALYDGLVTCTGGVYGGPTVTTNHPANTQQYYSQWAYGCVSGCKPFQSGFAGPPVPSGAKCPAGSWTTDADTMHKGLLPDANAVTEAHGSNVNQFLTACGCPGAVQAQGTCSVCCARNAGGTTYTIGGVSSGDCSWRGLTNLGYGMGAETGWSNFGKSGESILGWSGVSLHSKFFALSTCGCPTPTVTYTQGGTCTKCCLPKRGSKPGWQFNPKDKAEQPPKQCSGSGVTAGSTPGAATCSVPSCGSSCDDSSTWPSPKVVMDDAPLSVYDPIGVSAGDKGWNPMNEFFIKDEIAQYGPVEASFSVPDNFGSFFASTPQGVFVSSADQKTHGGHSVSIVGWGSDGAQKYWLVRNSWARSWAHGGFFKIEIGGHSSGPKVKFATASYGGIAAIAPFFKSGSARRLRTDPAKSRRLTSKIVHSGQKVNGTGQNHGASASCHGDHEDAITKMRTWFLANESNYNGVKTNCSVPWTYISQTLCSAKIVKGLQIHTTIHVEDCNNDAYYWHVRWIYPHTGDMSDAIVALNDGPYLNNATTEPTNQSTMSNPKAAVETASSAYMTCKATAAALMLLNWIFSNGF